MLDLGELHYVPDDPAGAERAVMDVARWLGFPGDEWYFAACEQLGALVFDDDARNKWQAANLRPTNTDGTD